MNAHRPLFPTAAPLPEVHISTSGLPPEDLSALDEEIHRAVAELYSAGTRLPVIDALVFRSITLPYRVELYAAPDHPYNLEATVLPDGRPNP